jgi:hypothetical protein
LQFGVRGVIQNFDAPMVTTLEVNAYHRSREKTADGQLPVLDAVGAL